MNFSLPKYLVIALLLVGAFGVCAESSSARYQNSTEESGPRSLEENILIVNEQRLVAYRPASKIETYLVELNTSSTNTNFYSSGNRTRLYLQFRSILI